MEDIYTLEEAAKYLKLSEDTIRRLIKQKKLKAHKVGGQWRIKRQTLDELFEDQDDQEQKPQK